MAAEELIEGAAVTPTLRLIRKIGGGGMGQVWLAQHLALDTRVVIKFIASSIADNAVAAARFRREAAAAAQVRSPHVVQMLDYGLTEEGTPFIVMELLEGEDLSERMKRLGRLAPREVVTIIRQVCKALGRAHDLGIIHRDIKPENIFLCANDDDEPFVKLLDFGIAKDTEDVSVTTTGSAVGTPHYMSPEQCVGAKSIDHRTDLWSLGVLVFYMLTGRRPFQGETTGALTLAIFNGEIPRPTSVNPALPAAIDAWFLRACARDPDERPKTAKALASELADALANAATPGAHDVDAITQLGQPATAPTVVISPRAPDKPATTLERAQTTGVGPFGEKEAAMHTTAGLSGEVSTARRPALPMSRAPLAVAALVVVALGGAGLLIQASRREPPPTPATVKPPAPTVDEPKRVEPAVAVDPPKPLASAAPTVLPSASTVQVAAKPSTIAPPTKPLAAKPSASIKSAPVPTSDDVPLK